MLAAVVSTILVTNSEQFPLMIEQLGISQLITPESVENWQVVITTYSFCGIFNMALIVGLGAMGGMIWFQRHGKSSLVATVS